MSRGLNVQQTLKQGYHWIHSVEGCTALATLGLYDLSLSKEKDCLKVQLQRITHFPKVV